MSTTVKLSSLLPFHSKHDYISGGTSGPIIVSRDLGGTYRYTTGAANTKSASKLRDLKEEREFKPY